MLAGSRPDLVAGQPQHCELVLELTQRVGGHIPDICVTRHQRQCVLLADTAHDDGWPWLLDRARLDGHAPHGEMRSTEIDSFVGERLVQDLQCLTEPRRPLGERAPFQTHPVVLVFYRSAADAEL
jgi:hypothetical protein